MKKYYFVLIWYLSGEWQPMNEVIDIHPFDYMHSDTLKDWARIPGNHGYIQTMLGNWQEITKEEYDKHKLLEDL